MSSQDTNRPSQAFSELREEQRRELVRLLRQVPSIAEVARRFEELRLGEKYKVAIPSDILRQIKAGTAHFGESSTGGWTANVHSAGTGKIVGQISIKEVSPEILSSLNQMAIQASLAEIAQRLESIEERVVEVIQGQRDDRIGLLDSGQHIFVLACKAQDESTRRLLLADAIAQISEARGRLIRNLETGISSLEDIPSGKWDIIRKSLYRNLPKMVTAKADVLEESLREVVRASCMLALSCGELNEPALLRESWQPLQLLLPRVQAAREKVSRWLPSNPQALPDKFSTLVAVADIVVQTGRQLESGPIGQLDIEFTGRELIEGEPA